MDWGAHIEGVPAPISSFFDARSVEDSMRYAHDTQGIAEPLISQHLVLNDLLTHYVLRKKLGEGSFGVAFTCGRRDAPETDTQWVVKLSTNLVNRDTIHALEQANAQRPARTAKDFGASSMAMTHGDDELGLLDSSTMAGLPLYDDPIVDLDAVFHPGSANLEAPHYEEFPSLSHTHASPHPFGILRFVLGEWGHEAAHQRARAELTLEFKNAERILEPPSMRQLRAIILGPHVSENEAVGKPLQNLNPRQYELAVNDRKRWQSLPGYSHLHPVVHFEPSIPMILSAQADGTLAELRHQIAPDDGEAPLDLRPNVFGGSVTPPLWHRIARQIASAVMFIDTFTDLAHLDIKPENVLFRQNGDLTTNLHCWLSDYGICMPKNQSPPPRDHFPGTGLYCPDARAWSQNVLYRDVSIYQYFSTMIDLLRLPCLKRPRPDYSTLEDFVESTTTDVQWTYLTDADDKTSLRDIFCLIVPNPNSMYRFIQLLWNTLEPYVHITPGGATLPIQTGALPFILTIMAMRSRPTDIARIFEAMQNALAHVT